MARSPLPALAAVAALLSLAACPGDKTIGPACPTASAPAPVPSAPPPVAALPDSDEGMWLLEDFPGERLQRLHGFTPTKAWLDEVRLSSVRLARGCSGSFVSSRGLVMTNHHCAQRCIDQLSTKDRNLVEAGFFAKRDGDEPSCPNLEIDQLVDVSDVTARVLEALSAATESDLADVRKATLARIEKECTTGPEVRCDVVDLYHGGMYHLYKYARHQDVRLVFAPEMAIAFFGGDPDNFMFPRYDLDVSFLRVYENGAPLASPHFFRWSAAGAKEGELTFVAGHPARTERLLSQSQLVYRRDVRLPERLLWLSELRGVLTQFGRLGAEEKRISRGRLFGAENSIKALKGMVAALRDPAFFAQKADEERGLRAQVAADPELAGKVGGAWDAIAAAQEIRRRMHHAYYLVEGGEGFDSALFSMAEGLVRAADERPKPNEERLAEFGDANLPAMEQRLLSKAPVYPALETLTLGASLVHLREVLGPDDPFVKKVLGNAEPRELAAELVKGSTLADPAVRKALWEGGKAAVEASKDPLIALARRLDADARAIRKRWDEIDAIETKNGELIAKARFAAWGTSHYPDATFSLRLSYGVVKGWQEEGKAVTPFTTFAGAFERATGKEPFALPQSWLDAKSRLDLATPFDFVTTNDIIGGNSGSPVFNAQAEIVGLIFDGNIHSLGGDFGVDPEKNRAVAVHSQALTEALRKVYGAERIADELGH